MMWDRHLTYALIFSLVFLLFAIAWDIDHYPLKTCASNQRNTDNCHRGIFHTLTFAMIISGIYLSYIFHMLCDYVLK